jgi:hypothetical protein
MRVGTILSAALLPLAVLAAPAAEKHLETRQQVVKPKACVRQLNPEPTPEETKLRHDKFAQAFIYQRNITAAFEFISQDYIVRRHPLPCN